MSLSEIAGAALRIALGLIAPACAAEPDFARQRQQMIEEQITARGVTDPPVLAALRAVPREEFVPPGLRAQAYADQPLPIGHGQTISQPFIVAFMTAKLGVGPNDRVLEIGTGSGYQAAILSRLASEVYTIEIVEPLARRAAAALKNAGCPNVQVRTGDGYRGWPEQAPFDAIIVTAAPEKIPRPLIDQLTESGRLVIPVGPQESAQILQIFTKKDGELRLDSELPVRFVPMTGEARR